MRVIAGIHKGRRLTAPPRSGVRPTAERVREALFSILAPRLADAAVLDLYCGTGAVGLEALSRGARAVVFVDQDPGALRVLRANLARCGYPTNATLVACDAAQLPRHRQGKRHAPYDIIFADPPYREEHASRLLALTQEPGILADDGVLIVEHASKNRLPQSYERLHQTRESCYGDTALTFYQFGPPAHENRHLSGHV